MTKLIAIPFLLGLAATTTPALARSWEEDTCVECGDCDPFEASISASDFELHQGIGVPTSLSFDEIENLSVSFPHYRSWCADDDEGVWAPVTFAVHGSVAATKQAMNLLDVALKGVPFRGGIEIWYEDAGGAIWEIELHDIQLISYLPLGSGADVAHPDTRAFEFTVQPGWAEIRVLE